MNSSTPLKRNSVSREAPGFFKIKGVPISEHNQGNLSILNLKGKMQMPDRRNGLCKDFPMEMTTPSKVINSTSRENPHWSAPNRKPLTSRIPSRRGAFIPHGMSKKTLATSRNSANPTKNNFKISTLDNETMRRHSTPLQKEELSFTARNINQTRLIPTSPVDTRPQSSLEAAAKLEGSQILRAKEERRLRADRKVKSPSESRSQLGTRRQSMDENIPAGDTGNYSLQINKRSASVSQALKKIDFRLKTNVDLDQAPHASCVIRNDSRVCYPADLKLAFHDYDISEGDVANKSHYMKIPQKPVVLYDPLLDVKRVVKPPDMEIPAFDKYKQNVAKLMSVPRAFNKKHGTFQFELNQRLKDGVFRKSMRQSYEDEQMMKRLLNSIASANMPLKKKKKSSMLLRLGKRSIDNSSQVVVPPEEANYAGAQSPYQQYLNSPMSTTPKPPKSSMSPYNRTQNMFTPYQQMANTQQLRKSGAKNGSTYHHVQNHSHDISYQRSHTEMSNYGHIPSRSNLYGASHFAKHKASGSIISGTSFTDGNTRPTVRRNTSIATATTAYTMRSGQDGLSPKEQEALKMQSVQLGLIQPYHGLNNMKAILNRSAINSPKRRTRQVINLTVSNVFSPVKRKKQRGEEVQNLTMDGRENAMLLQDGGMSTVIGNTFYGKIEEFERKQSAEGTPAFKRFSIPKGDQR